MDTGTNFEASRGTSVVEVLVFARRRIGSLGSSVSTEVEYGTGASDSQAWL
jgi:hypothetical protein